MKKAWLGILRDVLSLPTAPFREDAVVAWVRAFAERKNLAFAQDAAGNVLLRIRRGRAKHKWLFAAHMDHPGFVVSERNSGRTVAAEFRGGVALPYFRGSRVRLMPEGRQPVRATVRGASAAKDSPFLRCTLWLDETADVPPGTIGMWDLPPVRIRGQRVHARACDDLAGLAGALCAMAQLAAGKSPADVTVLLTRGEEAGFAGALAACEAGTICSDALVVIIETSAEQPGAKLGDGVVVRVGDRSRTYDPSLTAHVSAVAAGLEGRKGFRAIRRLMPGGTCEATAYCMAGLQATGLCLPLGNYHNQAPGGKISAERVDLRDFDSLVHLLIALAERREGPADTDRALCRGLQKLLASRRKHLR